MITSLSLHHYKNYTDESVSLAPGLNFLVGRNGMGKTNLLDAIHYLCMAKSHSTPLDRDTVQFDHPFFRLEAQARLDDHDHSICMKVRPREVKDILIDGKMIDRLSAYIGFLPVIMLSPEDIVLIQGGSAARRQFMDVALCQADRDYLENLQRYNKFLAQRNALLRTSGYRADHTLLLTYSISMADAAKLIYQRRDVLVRELLPDVISYYDLLCGSREVPALQYHSHLEDHDLDTLAAASLEADLQNGRTTKGVHRDDLEILLDHRPVKRFGSQGQIKSLLVALHLAQSEYLKRKTGTHPILLLDDIFDRLDEQRAQNLIALLTTFTTSQIFISDASPARVQRLITQSGNDAHVLEIRDGAILSSQQKDDRRRKSNL
ncbi:MAG TPA: DNA replication and repair protein RecF [Saprospiraceae bacterium]|nr:DNA replication and repair protein RecF [Saprospiraceae bacterium]